MEPITRLERAINLARSIASDLWLYNREKVCEGIRHDNLFDSMASEIDEGLRWYRERVDPQLDPNAEHFERAIVDVLVAKAILQVEQDR